MSENMKTVIPCYVNRYNTQIWMDLSQSQNDSAFPVNI